MDVDLFLKKVPQVVKALIEREAAENRRSVNQEAIALLEEALLQFPGCAVIISHDRWFLDRIATHMLAFEGDSQVVWFEGNYAEYLADRRKRLGVDADTPHRIKYRPLM